VIIQKHIIWYKGKLELKKHLKQMFFIFVMINWTMLYFQLDKTIMGRNNDLVGVSYYTLSERVVTLSSSFLFSFIMVVTARLGDRIMSDKIQYNILIQKVLNIIFLFIFPLSFFLFGTTNEILSILGGKEYVSADSILNVFVFYVIFYILMETAKTNILLLFKKEKIYFIAVILGGLINFLIKFIWGRQMSGFEVILTTLIIVAIILGFISSYSRHYLKVKFFNIYALRYFIISIPILALRFFSFNDYLISFCVKCLLVLFYFISILQIWKDNNYLYIKNIVLSKLKK